VRHFGPGLVSGASDDDPSGIATYTQAGAQLGFAACWIMPLCYPMMVVTQEISARIGRATGGGIIAALARHYPPWVAYLVSWLVVFANVVNLGADLGAMADVVHGLAGGPRLLYVALFGVFCAGLLIWLSYHSYVRAVKWAALSLFVYFLTAFNISIPWSSVLRHTFIPTLPTDGTGLTILVAAIGTTISPYLFIWQSSLEGERARHAGMMVAAVVAYMVMVTAAATLHPAGVTHVETTAQAAEALRPVAGPFAYAAFSLGILATGLLAVPMLAGSASYALAEGLNWPTGLGRKPREAPAFHTAIALAVLAGIAMNIAGIDPVRALIWSAVINGVVAAPVLVLMMSIAVRPPIMGQLALRGLLVIGGYMTAATMGFAAIVAITTIAL